MRTLMRTITVTQADIDNGSKENPISCPIALASKRVASDPYSVSVGTQVLAMDSCVVIMPKVATDWIDSFDKGFDVKPFSFKI